MPKQKKRPTRTEKREEFGDVSNYRRTKEEARRKEKARTLNRSFESYGTTDEGLDALLNITFHAATQLTTWYVLIFETDTTPEEY